MIRNNSVDLQLSSKNLCSIDVIGDGNCYFRALSVYLNGHESDHMTLRQTIIQCLATTFGLASDDALGNESASNQVSKLMSSGTWVGEEAILATSAYLQRDVHVFTAFAKSSPLIYAANSANCAPPITLAFYEPGHYKAVRDCKQNLSNSNLSTLCAAQGN